MRCLAALLVAAVAMLAGCSPADLVTDEEKAAAVAFIADLYAGRDEEALASMEPDLKAKARQILVKVHEIIPQSLDPKPSLMESRYVEFENGDITRAAELAKGHDRGALSSAQEALGRSCRVA